MQRLVYRMLSILEGVIIFARVLGLLLLFVGRFLRCGLVVQFCFFSTLKLGLVHDNKLPILEAIDLILRQSLLELLNFLEAISFLFKRLLVLTPKEGYLL